MREVLIQIAQRLREAPGRAEELVLRRGAVSDRLHRVLDGLKAREAEVAGQVAAETDGNGGRRYPNEQARQAEIARRLAADARYQALKAEADELRRELRLLDAETERISRRHRSDASMALLAGSLLGAGLRTEAEAALAAYGAEEAAGEPEAEAQEEPRAEGREAGSERPGTEAQAGPGAEAQGRAPGAAGLESGIFTVLEARPGQAQGVVRAWCEAADGSRVAVYARDAAGRALAGAAGRRVRIRYRRVDRGLFAVSVAPAEGNGNA